MKLRTEQTVLSRKQSTELQPHFLIPPLLTFPFAMHVPHYHHTTNLSFWISEPHIVLQQHANSAARGKIGNTANHSRHTLPNHLIVGSECEQNAPTEVSFAPVCHLPGWIPQAKEHLGRVQPACTICQPEKAEHDPISSISPAEPRPHFQALQFFFMWSLPGFSTIPMNLKMTPPIHFFFSRGFSCLTESSMPG